MLHDNLVSILTTKSLGILSILGVIAILHGLSSVMARPPYYTRLHQIQGKKPFSNWMQCGGYAKAVTARSSVRRVYASYSSNNTFLPDGIF